MAGKNPIMERKERLRLAIEEHSESQAAFARSVFGTESKRTIICRWVGQSKKTLPQLDDYVTIARATGRTLDWLMGLEASEDVSASGRGGWGWIRRTILKRLDGDQKVMEARSEYGGVGAGHMRGYNAVVDLLSPPSLIRLTRAKYLEAFDEGVQESETIELHRLRREVVRLRRRGRRG